MTRSMAIVAAFVLVQGSGTAWPAPQGQTPTEPPAVVPLLDFSEVQLQTLLAQGANAQGKEQGVTLKSSVGKKVLGWLASASLSALTGDDSESSGGSSGLSARVYMPDGWIRQLASEASSRAPLQTTDVKDDQRQAILRVFAYPDLPNNDDDGSIARGASVEQVTLTDADQKNPVQPLWTEVLFGQGGDGATYRGLAAYFSIDDVAKLRAAKGKAEFHVMISAEKNRKQVFDVKDKGLFAFLDHVPPTSMPSPSAVQAVPAAVLQAGSQPMTPEQLDGAVAPIALYPDPLVAQILAAATYPLEIDEANVWEQARGDLAGSNLMNAARTQPWDPSVQALVALPQVLALMDSNLAWTTALGNAFLSQPQDVMTAIERQRQRAIDAGKLTTNQEETVGQDSDDDIDIEPADSLVVDVPVYDPVEIWGSWSYNPWRPFWFPPRPTVGFVGGRYGFFISFPLGSYYGSGIWGGWRQWGWRCRWRDGSLQVNNDFYRLYNYRPAQVVLKNGIGTWVHDPNHRGGLAYPSAQVADRYGVAPGRISPSAARSTQAAPAAAVPGGKGEALSGTSTSGSRARAESNRGHESLGGSTPAPKAAAPAPAPSKPKPH
jgi:hypothetical protein